METPVTRRCRRVAIRLGMHKAPFILPTLAQVYFVERDNEPTMSVSLKGEIRVNPDFERAQSDSVLAGCIAHELMHLILLSHARTNGRVHEIWNIATDMAINEILRKSGISLPSSAIYPPRGLAAKTAEEIYDDIKDQVEFTESPGVGEGCGVEGCNGGTAEDAEAHQKWKETAIQARAISAGSEAGRALMKALSPVPPRAKYTQVLRSAASHALSQHGRDDQTWMRINRRSPTDILLPGWTATKARGAVLVDSSGSISDAMLNQIVTEVTTIQSVCSGVKLYLVVHDAEVTFAEWISATTPEKVQQCITGRGGTDFNIAYRKVEAVGKRLDFCIHLTDGECFETWPAPPHNCRRFIVARLGSRGAQSPLGTVEILVDL